MDHRLHDVVPAQALIFDMDGLLLDTERLYFEATQAIVAPFGHTVHLADYTEWIGRDVTTADFQALYPCDLTEEQIWGALRSGFIRRCETDLQVLPGVWEFLQGAAAPYPKAIASSTRRVWIDQLLAQSELAPHFPVRVSGKEMARGKPAPDIFYAAAAALGVEPAACVVFEDSPHGVRGAHEAGMRTVAVPTIFTAHCDWALADRVVERLDTVRADWLQTGRDV
ncbi:MAG: HAD family phosphatase [Fimbriimonadaceae bacterium]|nr:HAD family phosphatase [Fimbriimonadaceae bacterium]